MVERSDRAPLLDWEEVPSAEKNDESAAAAAAPPAAAAAHAKDRLSSPSNGRATSGCSAPVFGWSSSGPGGPIPSRSVSGSDGCSTPPTTSINPVDTDEGLRPHKQEYQPDSGSRELSSEDRMVKWEERDQIVSVFVVTFNTRSVYCCCCLANISLPGVSVALPEFRPFFYVNVADISALENELSYVACTTEKIFEEKKDLYDVYVDNQNVKSYRDGLKPLLRLSTADREKYRKLTEQSFYSHLLPPSSSCSCSVKEENGDCVSSEEDLFILFFLEQNNRIFQTLGEVAGSPDPTLTQESVRAMGLDPHGDRLFLLHLLEVYGYDTLLVSDQLCCS